MTARSAAGLVHRAVGDIVGGKYKLEHQLGEGGMGVVFAALHMGTGRRVALKCMAPAVNSITAGARFKREAQAAGRIDHPNVVQVFDVGEDERGRFIVMEFLKGEALGDLLHQGRLPPANAIDLLMPALRGVHAAHQKGVVHRDLKPDNIFVCRAEDGSVQVKVLDFGVSKFTLDTMEGAENLTRTGILLGTPQYMPPERVRGEGDSDRRADVYALGVILYEALTGRRPFDSEHVPELVARISQDEAPPLRSIDASIPVELEAVVLKAMSRRVADRYPDVASFARALERFAGEERFEVRRRDPTLGLVVGPGGNEPRRIPATETRRIGGSVTDRRLFLGASAVATLAVLFALGWAWMANEPAEQRVEVTAPVVHSPSEPPGGSPVLAASPAAPVRAQTHGVEAAAAPPPASATSSARRESRPAAKSSARTRPTAAVPHTATRESAKPRVARGVRTGGLSEQDF